ncbi:hypothetical protein [Dyella subtropica]|uniref:hypothetical protein n=1 Tax=Dyella subtropica TaxID=2992127 RepID=UPI00225284E2|nr:hypothetical protein [Dyella subtropica]
MERRRFLYAIAGGLALGAWLPDALLQRDYDDAASLYAALRDQPHQRLSIGGGDLDVVFADGAPGLDHDRVIRWIRKSATAVVTYFGRFPVKHVGLLVIAGASNRIGPATTYGFAGSAIRLYVGRDAADDAFLEDWMLVHEMIHLALPEVPRQSAWLLEGNATYIEPIARAQAGQLSPEIAWRWSVEDMPKGQPMPGDLGLDHTHTWGRTYWGGAAFWLLAEVAIYEQTDGRRSLQDALRAINRDSSGNGVTWSVDKVLASGDAATGTGVLTKLYAEMKDKPVRVDLEGLFRKLGVAEEQGSIVFDDRAPLARLRMRITKGR